MAKRKIFEELMQGVAEMKAHRDGKTSLRTYKVETKPVARKSDSAIARVRR
jgi:putative transcriptional regulator